MKTSSRNKTGRSAARKTSLSHQECQDALAWYMLDERKGRDPRRAYPIVYKHLHSCPACRAALEALNTPPRPAPSPDDASAARDLLPFLNPSAHVAWFQETEGELFGDQPRTTFLFNPVHLRALVKSESEGLRGYSGGGGGNVLLLNDRVTINNKSLDVQAWLLPSHGMSDRYNLHLMIQSPDVPRSDLQIQVQLQWGGVEYAVAVPAGEAMVENLPIPDSKASYADVPSPDFRLSLEAITDGRY